jgi:hypothetical protein
VIDGFDFEVIIFDTRPIDLVSTVSWEKADFFRRGEEKVVTFIIRILILIEIVMEWIVSRGEWFQE